MSEEGFEFVGYDEHKHYGEKEMKKERWSQAAIWICLTAFATLCFVLVIILNVQDAQLKKNGNSVTVPYTQGDKTVSFVDESGHKFYADITDTFGKRDKDTVTLYYYGDHAGSAKLLTSIKFWALGYGAYGVLLAICIWRIYKTVHVSNKHAVYKGEAEQ